METSVESPAAVVATAGTLVATRTGRPVVEASAGCEVLPGKGGGSEDTGWVIFFVDDVFSVELTVRERGKVAGVIKVTGGGSFRGVEGEGTTRGTDACAQEDDRVMNGTQK